MTTGRPMEPGRSAEIVRPLEAGRALERSRTMETRDPNGSPRRRTGESQHEVDLQRAQRRRDTPQRHLLRLALGAAAGGARRARPLLPRRRPGRAHRHGQSGGGPAGARYGCHGPRPEGADPQRHPVAHHRHAGREGRDLGHGRRAEAPGGFQRDGAARDAGLPAARQHPRGAGRRHTRSDGEAQHAHRQRLGAAGRRAAAAAGGLDPARPHGCHRHGAGQAAVPHRRAGRMAAHQQPSRATTC